MVSKAVIVKKGLFSKEWANDLLRWVVNDILYADCWIRHPYNKILIADEIIDRLNEKGYPWQARRVKNHLHRWMRSISEDPPASTSRDRSIDTHQNVKESLEDGEISPISRVSLDIEVSKSCARKRDTLSKGEREGSL